MARKTDGGSVLMVRFSALGDVAMTIPAIYGACNANPSRKFVMLTRKLPARLFVNAPANLTVVGIDTALYRGVGGMRRLYRELAEKYDISTLIDLHDVVRTKLLRLFARLDGASVVAINKGRREKQALTRHSSKKIVPLTPMGERYRHTFTKAGIAVDDSFTTLYHGGKGDPALFSAVADPSRKRERWIAIAPFAAHKGKVYPPRLMQQVVDHFARTGNKIFIFGAGEEERRQIDDMARGRENVVSMAEAAIGIEGELALMSHCDAMIAMDSANMHLASLAGLRTVSVWGATHPFAGFYGFRQSPADAVQLDMVCRPCSVFGNKPCKRKDYHCLNGISPHLIISRIYAESKKQST